MRFTRRDSDVLADQMRALSTNRPTIGTDPRKAATAIDPVMTVNQSATSITTSFRQPFAPFPQRGPYFEELCLELGPVPGISESLRMHGHRVCGVPTVFDDLEVFLGRAPRAKREVRTAVVKLTVVGEP